MRMSFRLFSLVIMTMLLCVGFSSCGSNDDDEVVDSFSIVGIWQSSYEKEGDKGGTIKVTEIFTFTPDGNYTDEVKGDYSNINKGTYSFSNNTLTLNEWSDREGYASYYIKVKVVSSKEMVWTPEKDPDISYTFKKM